MMGRLLEKRWVCVLLSVLLAIVFWAYIRAAVDPNGTATIHTETCAALDLDYDEIAALFAPLCTKVQPITTAESFEDLQG